MQGRPPETRMNWVLKFAEIQKSWASIFDIDHSRGFWETIYFSRKITITICTYCECTDQQYCMYNSIKVKFKFLCDKKVPRKGFYLEVWKIDSIFLCKVYFSNYQKCVSCWSIMCEGMYFYLHRAGPHILKRDWNMILNSCLL